MRGAGDRAVHDDLDVTYLRGGGAAAGRRAGVVRRSRRCSSRRWRFLFWSSVEEGERGVVLAVVLAGEGGGGEALALGLSASSGRRR